MEQHCPGDGERGGRVRDQITAKAARKRAKKEVEGRTEAEQQAVAQRKAKQVKALCLWVLLDMRGPHDLHHVGQL